MDPFSLIFTVLAIYGILKRNPNLGGEAVQEWRASKRGETTQPAIDAAQRLEAAGIEPAAGSPMGRYFGNLWRNYWLDRDEKAAKRRVEQAAANAAEETRAWRDRLDEQAARRVDGWRRATDAGDAGVGESGESGNPGDPSSPAGPASGSADRNGPAEGVQDDPIGVVHDSDEYPDKGPEFREQAKDGYGTKNPPPQAPPRFQDRDRDPIRVKVDVGDPIRTQREGNRTYSPPNVLAPAGPPIRVQATTGDPVRPSTTTPVALADRPATTPVPPDVAATTGGTMSDLVSAQRAVTGVVSGAAEARAIQRELQAATAAYVAQLSRIRNRIHALGDQTLNSVQLASRSLVVAHTVAAAEAAASAQAAANLCTSQVIPEMGHVARAFDRINS